MKKLLFLFLILQLLFSCGGDDVIKPIEEYPIGKDLYPELVEKYNIRKEGLVLEFANINKDKNQIMLNGRIDQKLWVAVYNTETNVQMYEWTDNQKLVTRVNLKNVNGVSSDYELHSFQARSFFVRNNELYFILGVVNSAETPPGKALLYATLYIVKNNALLQKHASYALPSAADILVYEGNCYEKINPWYNGVYVHYGNRQQPKEYVQVFFSSAGEKLYAFDNTESIIEQSEPIDMEQAIVLHSLRTGTINSFFSRYNLKTKESVWVSDKRPFEDVPVSAKMVGSVVTKNGNIWSYATTFTASDGSKIIKNLKLNIDTGEIVIEK